MIRTSLALVMVCALAGCGSGPKEIPRVDQLVGDYVLSEGSRTFLREQKAYSSVPDSEISLRADGTLYVRNLADCYIDGFGRGNNEFLSGTGQWEIERTDSGYGVTLTIEEGGSLNAGVYHGSSIQIGNEEPPFVLSLGVGDPDSREYLVYERKSS